MTRAEFAREMARLAVAYSEDVSDARAEVYFEHLRHATVREFAAAVREHVEVSRFFPRVSELLALVGYYRGEFARLERANVQPVVAIAQEAGDPAENRRRVRELIDSLKSAIGWAKNPAPREQDATERPFRGGGGL